MKKKNECGIFEKEGLFGKRGTKRGPLLAIFLKKSLRGTKNPKRDQLVITASDDKSPRFYEQNLPLSPSFHCPRHSLEREMNFIDEIN